jgi:hypothetical protein
MHAGSREDLPILKDLSRRERDSRADLTVLTCLGATRMQRQLEGGGGGERGKEKS